MGAAITIGGILLMWVAAYFGIWKLVRSRLAESVCGILLMWAAVRCGLWPLAPAAAIVTTYGLVRRCRVYRALPFILLLVLSLSFFLTGSAGLSLFTEEPGALPGFDVLRGALGAVVGLGIFFVTVWTCAELLIVHRGGDRRAAFKMMMGLLFAPLFPTDKPWRGIFEKRAGVFRALQIVEDGRVVSSMPPSEGFQMPGPGILIIRSGNAAVLERSGKITRIVGPGFHLTEAWEHLSAIVDLSLQTESWESTGVLTKDEIPLDVKFTVQYRITIDQTALITRSEYKFDEEVIRRAVLAADWKRQTEVAARAAVHDAFSSRPVNEIFDLSSPQFSGGATSGVPLHHELRRRLSLESQRWGVEIVRGELDEITPPKEFRQRMIEATSKLEAAKVGREIAKVEAKTREIQAKAEARSRKLEGSAKAKAEAERFRQVLISLQELPGVDRNRLCDVMIELAGAITDVADLHAVVRLLSRSAAPQASEGPTIRTIGGEPPPGDG